MSGVKQVVAPLQNFASATKRVVVAYKKRYTQQYERPQPHGQRRAVDEILQNIQKRDEPEKRPLLFGVFPKDGKAEDPQHGDVIPVCGVGEQAAQPEQKQPHPNGRAQPFPQRDGEKSQKEPPQNARHVPELPNREFKA